MAMKKRWIGAMNGGKGPKKGALHRELHVPTDKPIPKAKLAKAETAKGILGKRARLAATLEGFTKAHEPRDGAWSLAKHRKRRKA